jgi:hypothetical protein
MRASSMEKPGLEVPITANHSTAPAAPPGNFMEHRWGRRIECGARVRLSAGTAIGAAGLLRNVSMSGAFIETAADVPPFTRIAITVLRAAHGSAREVEVLGSVARVADGGVGVEWCETAPRDICPLLGCTSPCAAATRSWG